MSRRNKDDGSNIVVILDDVHFDKSVSIFNRKDRGLTVAQKLEGKIRRKTGSSMVLSNMEARQKSWSRKLVPTPRPNMIYVKHPFVMDKYIGAKQFHELLLSEKKDEFFKIMIAIGAKSISWQEMSEWSRFFEAPANMHPTLGELKETGVWLFNQPQWKHLVQERLLTWSTHGNISFTYEDDYSLNDVIIDKILQKIDAHPECCCFCNF